MYEIKKVKILSVAKIGACIGLVISLVPVLFMFFFLFTGLIWGSQSDFFGFPFLALFIFPITFTIVGFVKGLILGFIYNLITPRVGGIEMEIVLKEEKKE